MKSRNSPKFIAVIVGVVILCGGILVASTRVQTGTPHDTGSPMFTFSNPAAVYCTDLGYTYANIADGSGGIQGMCVFPDHTRCDAWDFLAGKCAQHYSYCSQQGYHVRTAKDAAGGFAQEVAICTDSEGQDIGSVDELTQLTTKVYACGAPDEATSRSEQALVHEPDPSNRQTVSDQADGILPSGWDWRNATYHSVTGDWTTPVKDQGGCGSCWAFAAVGISEAALNLAANNPALDPDLSEEYLVSDCHMLSGYQTCCGGWSEDALLFIRDTGIPDEACMTYVDGLDTGCGCDYGCNIYGPNACAYHGAGQCSDRTCSNRCSDWDSRLVRINQTGYAGSDRTTIQDTLVAYGPLSVSIRASNWFWDGDVLRCSLDAPTNHAVIVLGYQDTPGVGSGGYWIVKNSWGSTWNGDGYVKIGYGECSIEGNVFYASALGLSGLTPSPILPSGTISTATPTFKWSSSVGATSYKLAVWSESAQAYLIQNSVPSSSCDISECSYPSPINLSNGSYRFKVLAITPVGTTPYSNWLAFTITGGP